MSKAHDSRLNLDRNDCQAIATGLQEGYAKLDDALAHTLRLSASLIETSQAIGLDPLSSQKLYASLSDCAAHMLRGRENFVTAHQQAHKIRMRSTAADVHLWGCTGPMGVVEVAPEAAAA